ncbi:MAG: pseudouridine synthase [Candidatus Absconditabacterales bacterium]|nr:pseudouridine synthase [Candidatus Absconditabacterales bacterium]
MYIQQYLAHKNICSRRQGESWVRQGRVLVNGQPAQCGQKVSDIDHIICDPRCFQKIYTYYAYHKPAGILTINPQPGEQAIADIIDLPPDVLPMGRLDKDTSGLLILTNDRTVPKRILDPLANCEKEYDITSSYPITDAHCRQLEYGIIINGYRTKPAKTHRLSGHRIRLIITEGKKRQVREMMRRVGHHTIILTRVRIGPIHLGDLKIGAYRPLTEKEKFWKHTSTIHDPSPIGTHTPQ